MARGNSRRRSERSKLRIVLDILTALERDGGRSRFTKVLAASNMPYDRFVRYLEELESKGLIAEEKDEGGGRYLSLTQRGARFAEELRRMEEFLRGLGFPL